MKYTFKQLLTAASVLSLMQLSWWGVWVDDTDYKFGTGTQQITAQQIASTTTPKEDLHYLEKEPVEKPLKVDKDRNELTKAK
jgi:hypothetical protein